MTDRLIKETANYSKYKELYRCKNYAIEKAYRKFYYLPIEKDDLETIAWEAFVEVEQKFDSNKGEKSYESYFIDMVRWRCKDYCLKFANNKHKILNNAVTYDYLGEESSSKHQIDFENNFILRTVIKKYQEENIDNCKGIVLERLKNHESIGKICKELSYSKSKVYRVIKEIETELRLLLN